MKKLWAPAPLGWAGFWDFSFVNVYTFMHVRDSDFLRYSKLLWENFTCLLYSRCMPIFQKDFACFRWDWLLILIFIVASVFYNASKHSFVLQFFCLCMRICASTNCGIEKNYKFNVSWNISRSKIQINIRKNVLILIITRVKIFIKFEDLDRYVQQ